MSIREKEKLEAELAEVRNAITFIPSYIQKNSTLYAHYMVSLEKLKKREKELLAKLMNMKKK